MEHIKDFEGQKKNFSPETAIFIESLREGIEKWKYQNRKKYYEFADLAGISNTYLSDILLGNKQPTLDTVFKICKVLNKTVIITDNK